MSAPEAPGEPKPALFPLVDLPSLARENITENFGVLQRMDLLSSRGPMAFYMLRDRAFSCFSVEISHTKDALIVSEVGGEKRRFALDPKILCHLLRHGFIEKLEIEDLDQKIDFGAIQPRVRHVVFGPFFSVEMMASILPTFNKDFLKKVEIGGGIPSSECFASFPEIPNWECNGWFRSDLEKFLDFVFTNELPIGWSVSFSMKDALSTVMGILPQEAWNLVDEQAIAFPILGAKVGALTKSGGSRHEFRVK